MLTFFVALCALLAKLIGLWAILMYYLFVPTIIGATCGLMDWPRGALAVRVLRDLLKVLFALTMLLFATSIRLVEPVEAIAITGVGALSTLAAWMPQYAVVVSSIE